MSARTRIFLVVTAVALAAAAGVAGITALTSSDPPAGTAVATVPRAGAPPLSLDLGVRVDREARDLRAGLRLYDAGKRAEAGTMFARHDSLEARIGESVSRWPGDTVARLTQLAGLHPKSAAVQLNLGIAQFWAGESGSKAAWQAAAELEPDTAYAVTAGNLLHPNFARNLPVFVPVEEVPAAVRRRSPARQFAELERRARGGSITDRLFYGVALQRLGRQVSAERVYSEAARLAPRDAQAQVAAAVGRFDKSEPARAFSRLGPLSRTFPASATVRFHLGLLLLWSGEVEEARRQLRLVAKVEPGSPLVGVAKRYLDELRVAGI